MMKYTSLILVLLASTIAVHAKNSVPRLAQEFVIERDRVYVPEEKKVAATKYCPYQFHHIS